MHLAVILSTIRIRVWDNENIRNLPIWQVVFGTETPMSCLGLPEKLTTSDELVIDLQAVLEKVPGWEQRFAGIVKAAWATQRQGKVHQYGDGKHLPPVVV